MAVSRRAVAAGLALAAATSLGAAASAAHAGGLDDLVGTEWRIGGGCLTAAIKRCDAGLCAVVTSVAYPARAKFEERGARVGDAMVLEGIAPIAPDVAQSCGGLYNEWGYAAARTDWQSGRVTQAFLDIRRDRQGAPEELKVKTCAKSLTRKGCVIDRKLNALERTIARQLTGGRLTCDGSESGPPRRSCREGQGWRRADQRLSAFEDDSDFFRERRLAARRR